jgi:hypothetical protein
VEPTFSRWHKEYGGLQMEQAGKLKDLQKENAQPRSAVADLTVGKQILKDIADKDGVNGEPAVWCISRAGRKRYQPIRHPDEDRLTQAIVCTGQPVRALWLSAHHGSAATSRLVRGQRSRAAHPAEGRAEGSVQTEAARTALAERWILNPATSRTAQSCVELRLCGSAHARNSSCLCSRAPSYTL